MKRLYFSLIFSLTMLFALTIPTQAAMLPGGFTETLYADGLDLPTTMDFAPDGRIFVAEQGGALRVIKDGQLLPTPFLTVPVDDTQERGLLGVTFDPDFETNQYVYIYYTTASAPQRNLVVRYTANGDVAQANSATTIFEMDELTAANNHNAGALHFGPDDKLYVAVGDNSNASNSQSLETTQGKILRMNPDGTAPADNPFYAQTSGKYQTIWAMGLRNPFNFAIERDTGRIYINDVGQNSWEEVNEGIAGANYGWPATEGEHNDPDFVSPLYAYAHGDDAVNGCSIVGAAFYNPVTPRFPADYIGDYFFGDICSGWIKSYDAATDSATIFATGAPGVVDVRVSPDGYLYYVTRQGAVYQVDFDNQSDWITPNGTVSDSLGNPIYTWAEIDGATSYDLYLHRANDINDRVFYLTGLEPTCNNGVCSIDATTLEGGGGYWLPNGGYSAWLKANNADWIGPYPFSIQAAAPAAPTLQPTNTTAILARPVLHWNLDDTANNASWFYVTIARADDPDNPVLQRWFDRTTACGDMTSSVCTPTTPIDMTNGTYNLTVQGWGPGGVSPVAGPGSFTLNTPEPGLVTNMQVVTASASPTISWESDQYAAWYQVWVGTTAFETQYTDWHRAADLSCEGSGTCTLTVDANLSAGDYVFYVRSWGSGGYSTGGAQGWAEGPQFTVN